MGCIWDNDSVIDSLPNGSYLKVDDKGDIIGLLEINKKDFFINDEGSYERFEDDFFEDDFFDDEGEDGLIVDVDYVAELLQGLEPQELKYISKVCEVLIAEGEL